jgi:F-type H+-transporting ATPase subunit b
MEALGIEPIYLLAQLVNFAIIFFLLRKFLYKPVLNMLDKRKAEVAESIDRASRMEREEEKLKEKHEKLLTDAKKEARSIVDEAKKQLEKQKKDIVAKAHEQATEVLAKAKVQAEQLLKENEATMRKQAVELASAMVVKLVPQVLSSDDHRKLIATHLKDLEKSVKTVN